MKIYISCKSDDPFYTLVWGGKQVDPIALGDTSESFGSKEDNVEEENSPSKLFLEVGGCSKDTC